MAEFPEPAGCGVMLDGCWRGIVGGWGGEDGAWVVDGVGWHGGVVSTVGAVGVDGLLLNLEVLDKRAMDQGTRDAGDESHSGYDEDKELHGGGWQLTRECCAGARDCREVAREC